MDISVVIVNYKVKDFLLQCLHSIEESSEGVEVETIVVDNNSQDGSIEYLSPLFPNIRFIALQENLGFSKANNIGIAQAKGKYILILNPDTILETKTLKKMFDYMENYQELGAAGCKVLNPDGTFQYSCRRGFPTPWSSFCKLFGLQKLFPKSKFFASYNQTFRNENETYYIDAVMGAFMFCRAEALKQANGFDPDFFMYGEDLDLCYRINKNGWKIAYFHETTIVHYKGESTRRSEINKVKHFYEAMEIFAKKHYSRSVFFLMFLRLGIFIRSILAYTSNQKREIFFIGFDLLSVNLSLLLATKIKTGYFFGFPDHAYPTVYIVVSLVMFFSMFSVGEYFEGKISTSRSFYGLMTSFFILSSLTYFFKDYAFSRGAVLMTTGFSTVLVFLSRFTYNLIEKSSGQRADKRIAIIGCNENTNKLVEKLQSSDAVNAQIVGLISSSKDTLFQSTLPQLGTLDNLAKIIEEKNISEVIISDRDISPLEIIKTISSLSTKKVRFHAAQEYEEVIVARIISEITGQQIVLQENNLYKLRYRLAKRLMDIAMPFFLYTFGLPLLFLLNKKMPGALKKFGKSITGQYSFVGLYANENDNIAVGKPGIIGLAHISSPENLSKEALKNLNDYYIRHYNLSLDFEIFLKLFIRKTNA